MHPSSGTDTAAEAPARRAGGSPAAARPVFVDGSGRRQRRVRRIGRLLLIPAAGYLVLLLSTAFGGPTVSSPYVPLPQAGDHRPGGAGPVPAHGTHGPTATDGPAATTRSTATHPVPAGTPAPSHSPSVSPTAAAPPGPTTTPTHGKSTATHPVPTHTGHGHA